MCSAKMMSVLQFSFLFLIFQISLMNAKTAGPCDVADVMKNLGQNKAKAASWVCLAKFSSGFNTQAVKGPYEDGSYDFGIFQINDKYCRLGTKSSCGVKCTDLVSDDIIPSAKCALKIFEKEGGFHHWKEWNNSCLNTDRSRFLFKCSMRR